MRVCIYVRTRVCKCTCDGPTPKLRASWEMSRDRSGARIQTNIHRYSPFAGHGFRMRCWDCSIKGGSVGIGDAGLNVIRLGGYGAKSDVHRPLIYDPKHRFITSLRASGVRSKKFTIRCMGY